MDHLSRQPETAAQHALLSMRDIELHYNLGSGIPLFGSRPSLRAVDGVSVDIFPGETLGIVGESGCGKSSLARVACNLVKPTRGTVLLNGERIDRLSKSQMRPFRKSVQMVFQDPYASLNPRMSVFKTIEEPLIVHGIGNGRERQLMVGNLLERMGLNETHWHRFPHEFSGGQRQRIVIARALVIRPKLVICDEPVSALDVSVQSQIINLLKDLQQDFGLTYLFISHDLSIVRHMCDRVAVMYLGKVVEIADRDRLFTAASHPYTNALISSVPVAKPGANKQRVVLKGAVPSPFSPPSGCRFHTRCPAARIGNRFERCSTEQPTLREIVPGQMSACHFAEDVRAEGLLAGTSQ